VGLALAIAGGVALAGGVVETFVWQDRRKEFNTSGTCFENETDYGGGDCPALHKSLRQAQTLAIVGYATAGALGITSAIVFLNSGREPASQRVACAPAFGSTFGTAFATCRLQF
jgi:hypothetical protein